MIQKMKLDRTSFDSTYSLKELALTSYSDSGQAQYGNIYMRGALTAGLLDIRLLELSHGQRGLQDLILELTQRYGKRRAFPESTFVDTLVALTDPSIRQFFDDYVLAAHHLPIKEYYEKLGIHLIEDEKGIRCVSRSIPILPRTSCCCGRHGSDGSRAGPRERRAIGLAALLAVSGRAPRGAVGALYPRFRRVRRERQHRRRQPAPPPGWPDRGAARVRQADRGTPRGDDRPRHLPLGVDHQDPHCDRHHAAPRSRQALARRSRHEMGPGAPPGPRPLRLHGRRDHPDAAVSLLRLSESHLALHVGQVVGALRADAVGAACLDDAVPGAALRPGITVRYGDPAFIYLARVIEHMPATPTRRTSRRMSGRRWPFARCFGVTPYHLASWRSNNYTLTADGAGGRRVVADGREFDPGIAIPNGG